MQSSDKQTKESFSEPQICFILGIYYRSGTNYVFNMLKEHPECYGEGPLWEDFFLHHSSLLRKYVDNVYRNWNPAWEVDKKVAHPELLLKFFGDAISRFLRLQTMFRSAAQVGTGHAAKKAPLKIVLAKTPSVEGIEHFFDLFPCSYLVIIIRDGRALVESGVKSFNWNYETAMHQWKKGAKSIGALKNKYKNYHEKMLIIKYEDLFLHEQTELRKIIAFLDLDESVFDFDCLQSLGVIGSSDVKNSGEGIHWNETQKKRDFNPLDRFRHWGSKRHERFNWIAGRQMIELGYELEAVATNKYVSAIKNTVLDCVWILRLLVIKLGSIMIPADMYPAIRKLLNKLPLKRF